MASQPVRKKGEGSVAGTQAIFHRPANSGVYALICNSNPDRIGRNDITLAVAIGEESCTKRARAAIHALMASLIQPRALRGTPRTRTSSAAKAQSLFPSPLPAPTVSPLNTQYCLEMEGIAAALNTISPGSVETHSFDKLSEGVKLLQQLGAGLTWHGGLRSARRRLGLTDPGPNSPLAAAWAGIPGSRPLARLRLSADVSFLVEDGVRHKAPSARVSSRPPLCRQDGVRRCRVPHRATARWRVG